ncbi:Ubiquitin-conjugating enzyme E2 Z [Frankliniella fusca]|uniref:Ubiquitin-conjugating enzyme E2 Z n=1 Tax=Frankliniella fusca TaxID=407009 RepID=A0AAE1LTP9_9NEOP|nr:Ubiquitin-conjugating enzyme E2 Z [Frankliniella fusca]
MDDWDPFKYPQMTPTVASLRRVKKDIASLLNDAPPGVLVHVDDGDITLLHAHIKGCSGTPYRGGYFYFVMKCPWDYPLQPPKVRLMTTGGGSVRFNPNFYESGKVCLSILGTWPGQCWIPTCSLESVLISIQSVMCEKPLCNEPGFNEEDSPDEVEEYNNCVKAQTLKVAVCGMLNNTSLNIPQPLVKQMEENFKKEFHFYEQLAIQYIEEGFDVIKVPLYKIVCRGESRQSLSRLRSIVKELRKKKL